MGPEAEEMVSVRDYIWFKTLPPPSCPGDAPICPECVSATRRGGDGRW